MSPCGEFCLVKLQVWKAALCRGGGLLAESARRTQEGGDMANPRGCPAQNVKTRGEQKGVLRGHLGWAVGLGLSTQRPSGRNHAALLPHAGKQRGLHSEVLDREGISSGCGHRKRTRAPQSSQSRWGLWDGAWPCRCPSEGRPQEPSRRSPVTDTVCKAGTWRVTLRGWK